MSYLTPSEVRAKLGISRRTLARRVGRGEVPGVRLARGLIRIEARYVDQSAAEPDPAATTLVELARLLRVRARTLLTVVRAGELVTELADAQRALNEAQACLAAGKAASAEALVRRANEALSRAGSTTNPGISRRAVLRWLNSRALDASADRAPAPRPGRATPPPSPPPRPTQTRRAPAVPDDLPPLLRWLQQAR